MVLTTMENHPITDFSFNDIIFEDKPLSKEGDERYVLKLEEIEKNPKKPHCRRFTIKVWDRTAQKLVYGEICYEKVVKKHYSDQLRYYKSSGVVEINNGLI